MTISVSEVYIYIYKSPTTTHLPLPVSVSNQCPHHGTDLKFSAENVKTFSHV